MKLRKEETVNKYFFGYLVNGQEKMSTVTELNMESASKLLRKHWVERGEKIKIEFERKCLI